MRYVSSRALFSALMIASLTLIGCAKDPYSDEGLPTPSSRFSSITKDFPAVVLVILPGGHSLCTGTFVAERAVLTAAHCTLDAGTYQVITDWGTFSTTTRVNHGPGIVNDPNDISFLIFDTAVAKRNKGQVYNIGNQLREGDLTRLVGFGCNDIETRTGSGQKRTGTNLVSSVGDYIEFITPQSDNGSSRGILGAENRAGSCFGDSGGPALKQVGNELLVVGVTHAGGTYQDNLISEYGDVANRSDNRAFMSSVNNTHNLGIVGL